MSKAEVQNFEILRFVIGYSAVVWNELRAWRLGSSITYDAESIGRDGPYPAPTCASMRG